MNRWIKKAGLFAGLGYLLLAAVVLSGTAQGGGVAAGIEFDALAPVPAAEIPSGIEFGVPIGAEDAVPARSGVVLGIELQAPQPRSRAIGVELEAPVPQGGRAIGVELVALGTEAPVTQGGPFGIEHQPPAFGHVLGAEAQAPAPTPTP